MSKNDETEQNCSYSEATKITEGAIRAFLGNSKSRASADIRLDWAFGAYMLWRDLYREVIKETDNNRLGQLVGVKPTINRM
ncbi:hypothetical protein [Pectobacterium versatile]|uniref:hypothetical protein n=1 Tax=Pectobacterium versatile TaxID=2488639 RepID=UPI0030182887